jgi:hypothetical protein
MCSFTQNMPRRLTTEQKLVQVRQRIVEMKIDLADLKAEEKELERKLPLAGEDVSRDDETR